MKTLNYLPTLLALAIQMMVSGQTPSNQVRKIRVDIISSDKPVKMDFANSNINMSVAEYEQLMQQANALKISVNELRSEVKNIEQQYLLKQIEASELSGAISLQKFSKNRLAIKEILNNSNYNPSNFHILQENNLNSERYMKLASEIREEANAQQTLQARYAEMSNAEEKEALALKIQADVLMALKQIQPLVTLKPLNEIQNSKVIETALKTDDLIEAKRQAEDIKNTIQQLVEVAVSSTQNQKIVLESEVVGLKNDFLLKQIEISMLQAKNDYITFEKNNVQILEMLQKLNNDQLYKKIAAQILDANRLMKIGKEMREEANAQLTVLAKVGAMSNAAETEQLAMAKQTESLSALSKHNSTTFLATKY